MSPPVVIANAKVVAEGRPKGTGRLIYQVGRREITLHPAHRLPASTVAKVGDVGTLVIPQWVALTLRLA